MQTDADISEFIRIVRLVRADDLARIEGRIHDLRIDVSAIGKEHKIGYRCGFRAAANAIEDLLTEIMGNDR